MPGEFRENIPAAGMVLANTGSPGNLFYETKITFERADALTQNIRLYAHSDIAKTVSVRGVLFADFCVPRPGLLACDAVSDPNAPDVVAGITFGYGVVGVVSALGIGANGSLQVTGSVIDREKGGFVSFQELANLSASTGLPVSIANIPFPKPDFAGASVTLPVTFTALLKRGRIYRFQLAAAGTARGFFHPVSITWGESDAYNRSLKFPLEEGRVQLHNLTIRIGNDSSAPADVLDALRGLVTALQGQLGNLGNRIDALEASFQDEVSALSQAIGDQAKVTDVPGSLLMLPAGSPAPAGYTFVGTFDIAASNESRGRPEMESRGRPEMESRGRSERESRRRPEMMVDIYRRNSP